MDAKTKAGVTRRITQVMVTLIIHVAILFLASGQFDWLWAWIYVGLYLISIALIGSYLANLSPETIARRSESAGIKRWDRVVGGLWGLAHFIGIPLVAGLNERFAWTLELNPGWHLFGGLLSALGFALFGWAMVANTYFSTVVRILPENKHRVCDSGPYQTVRHPGYVGAVLMSLGIPLLLGSPWALLPGAAAAGLMIVRTALEDRFLQADLPGYADYAARVRYRLLPGVW